MSFRNFFLTVFSILMIFGISSCSIHSEINQFWSFDDILFNTMRQRWKDADMKNYVFEYASSSSVRTSNSPESSLICSTTPSYFLSARSLGSSPNAFLIVFHIISAHSPLTAPPSAGGVLIVCQVCVSNL